MQKAIVVLTRGYDNVEKYGQLIKRNNSITYKDKSIEFLIFHEGNILDHHQDYIAKKSPHLRIQFINIREKAFKEDKRKIPVYPPTRSFSLNYRHMCHFWFVDFWKFVEGYDAIIRIDEDCVIDFSIDEVFSILNRPGLNCVYGSWERDQPFVTHGLVQFTRNFVKTITNIKPETIPTIGAQGTYTNVIGLNLASLRQNHLLQKYIENVERTGAIYQYRWGDLPLWGAALFYLCHRLSYVKLDKIKYFHGSHNSYVGKRSRKVELKGMRFG